MIKGENGRAKQGGKAQLWILQVRGHSAGIHYKGKLFLFSHVISLFLFSPISSLVPLNIVSIISYISVFLISLTFPPKSDLGFNLCSSFESYFFSTRHNLQSPELLLKHNFKALAHPIQAFILLYHLHLDELLLISPLMLSLQSYFLTPVTFLNLAFTLRPWMLTCSPAHAYSPLIFSLSKFFPLRPFSYELTSQNFLVKAFTWKQLLSKTEK